MKVIHLGDALGLMVDENKNPVPFSVTYVTCDIERKKGGDIIKLEKCMLSKKNVDYEKSGFQDPDAPVTGFTKNPNHYGHATRNVVLPNGHVKKIHIRLILEFNGQKVFY